MSQLTELTLISLRDRLANGEVKAAEAVQACLDRISETEKDLNALLHLDAAGAMDLANIIDASGPDPAKPLWGVPLAIKDVVTVKGMPATCGSRILENFVPFYDAHLVSRLKEAGAIILAKTNMDECAMGSTTEHSAYKQTHNPWNLNRGPGGSSGGSAAAVAAGQCFGAIGTDTGGSIRQPSSFCGIVGLKPTYGRISRYGVIAYGSSLDQAGPMTRTPEDNALMLSVIAGHDPRDSTCSQKPVPDYLGSLRRSEDLRGVRLGLPKEYWGPGLSPQVESPLRKALAKAEELGAELVEVSLPHTDYAVATYYIVAMAEASSNLSRFDGVRYGLRDKSARELIDMYVRSRSQGFGDEVQRRIMIGAYVLSAGYYDAYYRKAAQVRRLIRDDFLKAFEKCDVICGAASPVPAFPIGELLADPLQMYLMDIFTISLNLAGLPGLSLPVGLTGEGLPVGMQLFGRAFEEETILSAAQPLFRELGDLGKPRGL